MRSALVIAFILAAFVSEACMTFVAGKKVSATGRVIVGHNEDDWPPFETHHGILPAHDWPTGTMLPATKGCNPNIPQVGHTHACYWSEVKFAYGDGNADIFFNEKGVFVTSDSGGSSTERMDDPTLLTEGGVKFNLRRMVGERAVSARDGVRLLCEIVEKYGYAPSARIYTVADKDEAWLVQVVHGRNYVAVRCPDDEITIMPNLYTVYNLDAWPAENVIVSPGLVENARRKGLWDGKGKFNFAAAYQGSYDYGDEHAFEHPNNTGRFRQAVRVLTGREWPADKPFPFSVKPSKAKFSLEDMKAVMSAHNGPLKDGRHVLQTWSICSSTTIEATICEFADNNSDTMLHVALGRACETPFKVFRPFGDGMPKDFDESSTAEARLRTHVEPMDHMPYFSPAPGRKDGRLYYFVPDGIDFAKPSALLVFLHGGDKLSLDSQPERYFAEGGFAMPMFRDAPFIVAAPSAPPACDGSRWNREGVAKFIEATIEDAQKRFNIDPDRIFLGGHSMGGYGAYHLGQVLADRLAGVWASAGAWWSADFRSFEGTPVYLQHGSLDCSPRPGYSGSHDKPRRHHWCGTSFARAAHELMTRDGIDHVYDEHGGGHSLKFAESVEATRRFFKWSLDKRRNPYAKKVTLITRCGSAHPDVDTVNRTRWLEALDTVEGEVSVDMIVLRGPDIANTDEDLKLQTYELIKSHRDGAARIVAENLAGNRFRVETENVKKFRIYLSSAMGDLSRPFIVGFPDGSSALVKSEPVFGDRDYTAAITINR